MFRGKVIRGDGVGRTLGYPTANLDTPKNQVSLGGGVYAVRASCLGKEYPAALVIQDEPWKVEVHLINYDGQDCYGRMIDVDAVQKVSELEWFDSEDELKQKIQKDIDIVKRILNKEYQDDDGLH